MKKSLIIFLALIVLLYVLARIFGPEFLDRQFNSVIHPAPYNISEEAQTLYQSFDFVSDLHSDLLLWKRDILKRSDYAQQDIPRNIEANMALQFFTLFNKVPAGLNFESNPSDSDQVTAIMILQGRPVNTWFDLTERVIHLSETLHQFAKDSNGKLFVIESKSDLTNYIAKRKLDKNITAGLLGIEGAQALKGDIKNLQRVYDAGVRMIGLTHFFDNEVGGSAHGMNKRGITEFGKQLIPEMEKLHVLVDIAHASPKLIDDVLAIATKPIIVSHTGVKGTCDNVRNLSDDHLIKIAKTGGIIGIAVFEHAVCGTTAKAVAKAIKYTVDLVGAKHVALGSDFEGAITAIFEVSGLPLVVQELLAMGMSEEDIRLVMGDNVKRVLLKNLPD
ncbi:MAG: peptidase M19 [Kangiella sp.]|nr:MAG: peptidase M19 [Kangiella sp.]